MTYCKNCDPKYFVVYGFCGNGKRRCEPPLLYPDGPVHVADYEKFRKKWNEDRADLINDVIRRGDRDELV